MNGRTMQFLEIFKPFYGGDWCYETKELFEVFKYYSQED